MAAATTRRRRPATKPATKPAAEEVEELDLDDVEVVEEEEKPKPRTRRAPARKTRAKAEPEPEEDEDDEEEEAEEAPKAKAKRQPPKRREIAFGTKELVEHVNDKTGKSLKSYDIRALLRKMARNGELDREVGTDRARYEFAGPNDPLVKKIVAKVKAGETEKAKKEALDGLKKSTAAKKAAAKKAKDEDVDDEEIEDDFDELDVDEDEDDE